MLNIGRLAPGGEDYYLETVAATVEDYYTGRREAPGRWVGEGSRELSLEGTVGAEQLRAVLGNRDPYTGEPLVSARNRRVPGFDLAFRPPKSVSLLWAFHHNPQVSLEVRRAHDAAVGAAIGYIEAEVVRSRRGHNGAEQVEVTGLVAAAFRHRTSRADDPLLHTHVLVANCVRAVDDGKRRTLDSRRLYRHAKTAGLLYQAHLRHELTQRLGVAWEPVVNGHADIAGVPRELIEAFSTRRAQILEALAERGESSARAAQVATLETRPPKNHGVDVPELIGAWRDRAAELGFGARQTAALTGRHAARQVDVAEAVARMVAADGLTAHASMFDRRDVLQAWCQELPDGALIAEIQRLADAVLDPDTEAVIDLDDPAGLIRRLAGSGTVDDHRFTTPELLATEQHLIESAVRRVDACAARVPRHKVAADPERWMALSNEQRHMARELLTSGRGVEVVVGKAGSGKTTALAAARAAWEAQGVRVVGCALAARAAFELEDGSGIHSTTIARLLIDFDDLEHGGLEPSSVLVVDEAGMVGTRTLVRLLDHAAAADAKVVLVGDHHQLPEIDAGGVFASLAARLPTIELTDNHRQHEHWEREALDALRNGDVAEAVARYRDHERIDGGGTTDEVRDQLVDDWFEAKVEYGLDAIMLAHRRADVAALNARARERLAAAGELTGPEMNVHGRSFQVGDQVVCLRNNGRLGVMNGTRGTVTAANPRSRSLTFRSDHDRCEVTLSPEYLDEGLVDHGYAVTVHKAQGLTCDATFALADDGITREWGYVALSRGRHTNRLYLTEHRDLDAEQASHPNTLEGEPPLTDTSLPEKLTRSRAQQAGIDVEADAVRRRIAETQQHEGRACEIDLGIGI